MSLDVFDAMDIIEVMENYLEQSRPAMHMQDLIDIAYHIDNQSVILFEIRPSFKDNNQKTEKPYAKARFVKARNYWKIYWMNRNEKWESYNPRPYSKNLQGFLKLVDEDVYGCFQRNAI